LQQSTPCSKITFYRATRIGAGLSKRFTGCGGLGMQFWRIKIKTQQGKRGKKGTISCCKKFGKEGLKDSRKLKHHLWPWRLIIDRNTINRALEKIIKVNIKKITAYIIVAVHSCCIMGVKMYCS
jgi:hypothetical protein